MNNLGCKLDRICHLYIDIFIEFMWMICHFLGKILDRLLLLSQLRAGYLSNRLAIGLLLCRNCARTLFGLCYRKIHGNIRKCTIKGQPQFWQLALFFWVWMKFRSAVDSHKGLIIIIRQASISCFLINHL